MPRQDAGCWSAWAPAAGVFLAAAAMATSSAAPAKADFEALIDPIIQPLSQLADRFAHRVRPGSRADLTSWSDSFLASLNSIDLAVPAAGEPAAAVRRQPNPPRHELTTSRSPCKRTPSRPCRPRCGGSPTDAARRHGSAAGHPVARPGVNSSRLRTCSPSGLPQSIHRGERLQRRGGLHLSDYNDVTVIRRRRPHHHEYPHRCGDLLVDRQLILLLRALPGLPCR